MRQVRVVAALLRQGARVLVQQRGSQEARALQWEFPGGKVEPGETDEQALVRECREEMGVEVAVGAKVAQNVHRYDDLQVDLSLYECLLRQGEPRALHARAVAFVDVAELAKMPFCAADVPFLRAEILAPVQNE